MRSKGIAADYSEKDDKSHLTDETIWKHLLKRVKGSSITVVILSRDLIFHKGEASSNFAASGWVYKEMQASLRDGIENRINGVVAVVEDDFYDQIVTTRYCSLCGKWHKEYNKNLLNEIIHENTFNVKKSYGTHRNCAYNELHDSYITIVKVSEFLQYPNFYIDNAWEKRQRQINKKEFEIKNGFHL